MSDWLRYRQIIRASLLLLFWYVISGCAAQLNLVASQQEQQKYTLVTDQYRLEVAAVGPDSLEFLYIPVGGDAFPSFAKTTDNNLALEITESDRHITISSGQITAIIDSSSGAVSFYRGNRLLTQQLPYLANGSSFDFMLNDEEIVMGAGQRVLGMNRRGHRLPLYNRADYGYTTESQQMNFSLPAVMSNHKYYLLFDNTAKGTLDIGAANEKQLQFRAVGGRSAYIIGADSSYPELIDEYTQVTGRPAMLPRWALGHFISRFGYRSQQEVTEVVELTQDKDIPADAVILDLYWFGPDIKGHMGNLAWDKQYFPEPDNMISDFSERGIKTILITEPFILTTSQRWQDAVESGAIATTESGEPYEFEFYFGNTGLIDVFSAKGRNWFSARYRELFEQNVAGNWGDLGEPEVHPDDIQHYLETTGEWVRGDVLHNAYGHEWAKLVYDTEKSIKPDSRPFILMRSGFAGSQRYGIIPWTGDVSRSWGGLKPQVELSLQMSLFGLGYTHSDIGGFAGTEGFEPELYLRWSQYGIFQPIYRPHAQEQIASEVVFQDSQIRDVVTEFIKLRYRLTPYNYTLMREHSTTGMPLMRPMFFTNEANESLIGIKDQYFWGDAFLVKPITEPDVTSTEVMLPEGQWFNFWTDTIYSGSQTIQIPVSLADIPVLVKAGSFIPMVNDFNQMTDYSSAQLTLHYYHHATVTESQGSMFEDDGTTDLAVGSMQHELLTFEATSSDQALTISLHNTDNGYAGKPDSRDISLQVHGLIESPEAVLSDTLVFNQINYDSEKSLLTVTFQWSHEPASIKITQ